MSRTIKGRTFSRRDVLFTFLGRWRRSDTPNQPIGFDADAREIEDCLAEGRFGDAAEILHGVLVKSPDHIQAMQKLAYCRLKLGQAEEAAELLHRIRAIKPKDNFAALYLGLALCRTSSLEEAIRAWREYFNIDQPIIQRAVNLQLALYDMDGPSDPQEMADAVEEAVQEQARQDARNAWKEG